MRVRGERLKIARAAIFCALVLLGLGEPNGARVEARELDVAAGTDGYGPLFGQPISAVEVRSDAPLERPEQALELLVLRPGSPLTAEAVARSLRNLQAAAMAGEVAILVRQEDRGLVVVVVLKARIRVNRVGLVGDLGLSRSRLERALLQRSGDPLQESRVVQSVFRLQELYEAEGYLEASATVDVDLDRGRKQAEIEYRVSSGPEYRVQRVEFEGDMGPFSAEELQSPLRMRAGERFRRRQLADERERLEGWLFDRGHQLAEVGEASEKRADEDASVDLVYPIEVGPRLEVVVRGAERKDLEEKGLLLFAGEERFDTALVIQSVERIRTHFQRQGRYRVEVEWSQEALDGVVKLTLTITAGSLYELERLDFEGNEEIGEAQLRPLIKTGQGGLLGGRSQRLVDLDLAEDLANLRSFYALQGFLAARIGPPRVTEPEAGRLRVAVPIEEGPRTRVVALEVEGADSLDLSDLLSELALQGGGPYHISRLEEAREQIRALYTEEGFDSALISSDVEWNEQRTLVNVLFSVIEGPRRVVDRVIVRGARRTRPSIIRRAVRLKPGEPVSPGRLLEVQRRLYKLGTFSRVEVRPITSDLFSSERDILVQVEEGKRRRITYGIGYDSEDGVRGLLGYSQSNLFGRAMSGRLDLQLSRRERQVRALVRQPFLGRFEMPVTYSLFRIEEEERSFDSKRWGGEVEVQRVWRRLRLDLQGSYEIVELEAADLGLEPLLIDRNLREVEIASLSPAITLDRRDDPVDPRRGWSSSSLLQVAFPLLAAETEFVKLFNQQTGYLDLGGLGVLAASVRVAGIEPYGSNPLDPSLPAGLSSAQVPISERFFGGGRSTHRAYGRDRLGIRGETLLAVVDPDDPRAELVLVPVGGNGLLLVNLDYRFPIAGGFGGTVFVDAGNVWADWRSIDPTGIKLGAGVGLRYSTPVGPVRVEVGWKLDREETEDSYVILLSLGNPF